MRRRDLMLSACVATTVARAAAVPVVFRGKEVTAFHYGEPWDKPFLYPLRTVSGKVISRGFPLEKVEGESIDHPWHRGLFYGHGSVNGHDFWREQGRDKTSRLVVQGAPVLQARAGRVTLRAAMAMTPPDGKSIATMRHDYAFEDRGGLRTLDAEISMQADQGVDLKFGDTDDGGFAFRLSDAFRQDRGARLRNSNGLETTGEIWGQPARWVDYEAVIGGSPVGVAILDHPANLRHPTGWHARGYSLCSANPFATRSFGKGKGPDGAYTLVAGQRLALRYRVLIHEGPFEPEAIEAEYRRWAR